jgi:glycerol-3-phosphate dehydrogenase
VNSSKQFDMVVVGGGVNGTGIARDAAGRGLRVLLCEQDDLAMHTSSRSTKLIHGGLRYLEHYEFRLVRESLQEREVLLRAAPHIIWPLRFVLPHHSGLRPAWMIRLGLFLYDHLGHRERLPGCGTVSLPRHETGAALQKSFTRGFVYSDCWVQDARLVVLTALDAAERGARILTRHRCKSVRREADHWQVDLRANDGLEHTVSTRTLVNAAGPWANSFLKKARLRQDASELRLVKGSHIVVPRLFDHPYAYLFQHADGRVVFAIPYEHEFTLIGTTDVEWRGDPGEVAIEEKEVEYLCSAVNEYFVVPVSPDAVVWAYAGVRALYDDEASSASEITRDYVLDLDRDGAPLLSVFGGKLTTYRKLAEQVMEKLRNELPNAGAPWTCDATLPGGDLPQADFDAFLHDVRGRYSWLAPSLCLRYARNYGTRLEKMLGGVHDTAGLGENLGAQLHEVELQYLRDHEWAQTSEDVLWRRSKLGLFAEAGTAERIDTWLARAGVSLSKSAAH